MRVDVENEERFQLEVNEIRLKSVILVLRAVHELVVVAGALIVVQVIHKPVS